MMRLYLKGNVIHDSYEIIFGGHDEREKHKRKDDRDERFRRGSGEERLNLVFLKMIVGLTGMIGTIKRKKKLK